MLLCIQNISDLKVNFQYLPKRKSVMATSNATILEEQAVSITIDGPLKSNTNETLFAYIVFAFPG